MKTQSKYSPAEIYKLQKIKSEIQDLRKQLLEIDHEIGGIKQNIANEESKSNQTTNHFQEWLNQNDNSKVEPVEEDKETFWVNYILVILIAFYLVLMSFI
ncbi:hypothetical protein Riv7116_3037 [Rivularia sp. PCC 7116]|uniref:hypothetical protein n=1 Tax=Rivularia sp. PCC 7116 TaxID=373994 RepID=UPI00029EEA07|nr:hypothetical protein [Rivularia sp. PCC 7116]AFY55516.1 hypothetical protein Riv7116_3037 [Rivularia sp. PCC 7116]